MALIHIVEDDLQLRELYQEALRGRGHEVSSSRSLELGLTWLAKHEPDLVVTDLELPDGSGFTMVRAAACRSIPVLIASGQSSERDFLRGSASGARDFLVKPFPLALLLSKVDRLLKPRLTAADHLLPGGRSKAFGRYRILETVGQGGSGVVFRALDRVSGSEVALKVHTTSGDKTPGSGERIRRRFQREAYSLSSVSHPNVVGIRDQGSERGFDYIAMDYVKGVTLAEHVRQKGPLDEDSVRLLLGSLASALAAIHSRGLVHRDLTPENIVLRDGAPGSPVIVDFGLTKLPYDRSLTLQTERHGTPAYMAPEQIAGEGPTPKTDLFSLGLVACFAATGHRAFEDLDLFPLLLALSTRPVQLPDMSPDLRDILRGLTKIRPEARTASVSALLEALEGYRKISA